MDLDASTNGLGVMINRTARVNECPFKEVFSGFENVKAVKEIFGDETDDVLSNLRVDVNAPRGYLRIDDQKGSIMVNPGYLRSGNERYLYLDVIHELVHIRQFKEGKDLFDRKLAYVDRPTEIEAYLVTVKEAKRIGMTDEEIREYLKVEWVSEQDFERLLVRLGVSARPNQS